MLVVLVVLVVVAIVVAVVVAVVVVVVVVVVVIVVVFFLLVVVFVVVVVVVVVAAAVAVVVVVGGGGVFVAVTLKLFLSPCQNRNSLCFHVFSRFVETLRANSSVNTDVFCASEAQNHGIYDVFCLWWQQP